jgi:hypothetical protein
MSGGEFLVWTLVVLACGTLPLVAAGLGWAVAIFTGKWRYPVALALALGSTAIVLLVLVLTDEDFAPLARFIAAAWLLIQAVAVPLGLFAGFWRCRRSYPW